MSSRIPLLLVVMLFWWPAETAPSHLQKRGDATKLYQTTRGLQYSSILQHFKELEELNSSLVKLHYFYSANGNKGVLVKLGRKNIQFAGKRPVVYISGATHANEYLHIVDRLPEKFIIGSRDSTGISRFLNLGGIVYILPIFNPDGFLRPIQSESEMFLQRVNGNRIDLNRDFPLKKTGHSGLTQPETKFITKFLQRDLERENAQLVLTWDYHCCMNPGRLLYPWGYRSESKNKENPGVSLTRKQLRAHKEIASIVFDLFKFDAGTPWDEEKWPGYFLGGVTGASDDYFFETYFQDNDLVKGRAFTFEGDETPATVDLNLHIRLWDKIFLKLTGEHRERRPFLAKERGDSSL